MSEFDPFKDFRMQGHSAIVTGGAQNIGEAIARSFAGAGSKVMIADLNGDKAEATAEKIARIGVKSCNATSVDDVNADCAFRCIVQACDNAEMGGDGGPQCPIIAAG
jgi:7-alpha-hydroxysteroid dehydrogenase